MKHSILSIIVLSLLIFSSCSKDKDQYDKNGEIELREGDMMSKKECFEFVFPLGAVLPDGSVVSGNDEKEFFQQLKDWYKNNPNSKDKPSLNYPVEVSFKDDVLKTIENEDGMKLLKEYCEKKYEDKKECFEMVYPLDFEMPDESTISVNNEDEMHSTIKAWYEANPDSKEKYNLLYPVEVILEDGQTTTVNNEDEMIALKKDC